MRNKKAASGEMLIMIYRLVIVTLMAFIIIGTSAVVYDFYIDVRDTEARIMAKHVLDCVAPGGKVDLTKIPKDSEDSILDYCGFLDEQAERFYVKVEVEGTTLKQGDSGKAWIRDFFEGRGEAKDEIAKYEPGYFSETYRSVNGGKKIKLEVLVAEV